MKTTLCERNHVCGTCYAGRTGSCSSRYADNMQTAICVAVVKQREGVSA